MKVVPGPNAPARRNAEPTALPPQLGRAVGLALAFCALAAFAAALLV
jgi:hypothetical protein